MDSVTIPKAHQQQPAMPIQHPSLNSKFLSAINRIGDRLKLVIYAKAPSLNGQARRLPRRTELLHKDLWNHLGACFKNIVSNGNLK